MLSSGDSRSTFNRGRTVVQIKGEAIGYRLLQERLERVLAAEKYLHRHSVESVGSMDAKPRAELLSLVGAGKKGQANDLRVRRTRDDF